MLVLSRKTGERVVIAGNVRVVVLSVHRDRVRLGFEGPANVPIHREEIHERIVQETAVSELAAHRENGRQRGHQRPRREAEADAFPHHAAEEVLTAR